MMILFYAMVAIAAVCYISLPVMMMWLFVKFATNVSERQEQWRRELDDWHHEQQRELAQRQ